MGFQFAPTVAPAPAMPGTLDMDEDRDLPEQGYDEFRDALHVNHDDKETMLGDWRGEWPQA